MPGVDTGNGKSVALDQGVVEDGVHETVREGAPEAVRKERCGRARSAAARVLKLDRKEGGAWAVWQAWLERCNRREGGVDVTKLVRL